MRGDQIYPLTVKITEWEVRPHPQAPERGDAVHFSYHAAQLGLLPETSVELAACAVDSADIVLLCGSIAVARLSGGSGEDDGDSWLGPVSEPDLADTARVLVIPNQLSPGLHAGDPKDGDGYVPPRIPTPGDQLRTR